MQWSEEVARTMLSTLTVLAIAWLFVVACIFGAARVRHTHEVHATIHAGNTDPYRATRSAA
jgi:hypothetical protein